MAAQAVGLAQEGLATGGHLEAHRVAVFGVTDDSQHVGLTLRVREEVNRVVLAAYQHETELAESHLA